MLPYLDGTVCRSWSAGAGGEGLPSDDQSWHPAQRCHLRVLQQGRAREPMDEREDSMAGLLHCNHRLLIPPQPQEREKKV